VETGPGIKKGAAEATPVGYKPFYISQTTTGPTENPASRMWTSPKSICSSPFAVGMTKAVGESRS